MKRNETIERLKRRADAIRALGATSLYLFGSAACGETGPASDLDPFIDSDPTTLHPLSKDRIENSAFQVFCPPGDPALLPNLPASRSRLPERQSCLSLWSGSSRKPAAAFGQSRERAAENCPAGRVRAIETALQHEYHCFSDRIIWGVIVDERPKIRIAVAAIQRQVDEA
ncbi:nucleotidyltransferase domain-containing protein [Rhizobium mongolense]|uniref:nucleotidyltransferase domain-containing protein n=1 Tax=Rhizobium mongolense TaxID=57676 RepID=UPI001113AF84|nr:nucleotidyltransferase domain-containing protein [Rhizobium mongolense]